MGPCTKIEKQAAHTQLLIFFYRAETFGYCSTLSIFSLLFLSLFFFFFATQLNLKHNYKDELDANLEDQQHVGMQRQDLNSNMSWIVFGGAFVL